LESLIRDCVIVLKVIIGKLVYLEIAIYVLQISSKSLTNNYETRLYKIIAKYKYKLIISIFSQHECHRGEDHGG
jgi:hypothetical protein